MTLFALLSGCTPLGHKAPVHGAVDSRPPFDPTTSRALELGLSVHDRYGAPLSRVRVQLIRSDEGRHELVWTGYTNDYGEVRSPLLVASGAESFELTLNRPGYSGDYSQESRRVRAGVFASSSILDLSREQLSELDVELNAG